MFLFKRVRVWPGSMLLKVEIPPPPEGFTSLVRGIDKLS